MLPLALGLILVDWSGSLSLVPDCHDVAGGARANLLLLGVIGIGTGGFEESDAGRGTEDAAGGESAIEET